MNASTNSFVITPSAGENHANGIGASNKVPSHKSSFLADFTNLLSKSLGAGVSIASSAALPGIAGMGVGAVSDKLVQTLIKNLGSNSVGSADNSNQIVKQYEFHAPDLTPAQDLSLFLSGTNPYISNQNIFKPVNTSSVNLRI